LCNGQRVGISPARFFRLHLSRWPRREYTGPVNAAEVANEVLRWIHTFLFFTWMWLLLFLSIALLIPMFLFRLLRMRNAEKGYVYGLTKFWARQHNATAGARVQVVGKENIPDEGAFCIIGNHQGSMDIPILMAYIPRTLGFIAKAELKKVPFISSWMKAIGCVFIDRKNLRPP
jgi:1-acyl-sn-glycerol-3-phosphate acyltransferase